MLWHTQCTCLYTSEDLSLRHSAGASNALCLVCATNETRQVDRPRASVDEMFGPVSLYLPRLEEFVKEKWEG